MFTRVLKGHIAVAKHSFKRGTKGNDIDYLARQSLQEVGCDHDHGTGHGIGSFLSVHEGPQRLAKKSMFNNVELIDLISLKPFDMNTISKSIKKTHRVVIVEECMKTGGIAAELMSLITENCFDDLDSPPVRLSSQDIPTPYNGNLENLTIIQPHQIVDAAEKIVNNGGLD